jgi:hypothetical protein
MALRSLRDQDAGPGPAEKVVVAPAPAVVDPVPADVLGPAAAAVVLVAPSVAQAAITANPAPPRSLKAERRLISRFLVWWALPDRGSHVSCSLASSGSCKGPGQRPGPSAAGGQEEEMPGCPFNLARRAWDFHVYQIHMCWIWSGRA